MYASLHPGSKNNGPEIFGDHMVTDKSYQLSYLVVHMVSQLQVVADDSTYEDCYLKFNQVQERIRIKCFISGTYGILTPT